MSNRITDETINEIQDSINADSQGRTAATPLKENKVEFKTPTARPLKKANADARKVFNSMCVAHEKIRKGIEQINIDMTELREKLNVRKGRLSNVKNQIGEFCSEYGVTVQPKIDSTGKAFYNRPWKAQAEIKRNAATMAEPIRLWAEKKVGMVEMLFTPDPEASQMLDVTAIRKLLETESRLDPDTKAKLRTTLNALMKLGEEAGLVQNPEATLNLEAYDDAKLKGLIPSKVLEQAEESAEHIGVVSVDRIIDFSTDRCAGCSDKLPKRRETGHKCKRCGTEAK